MRWRDFQDLAPLPDDFFNQPRRIHFIGVGGIGMSALAFALKARGHFVSGSDANPSAMTQKLEDAGIKVVFGHDAANLQVLEGGAEAIIFGSAITPDNPERVEAHNINIPEWHRAQLLAYFVNTARFSIAVSGTHGKSTTSAMIAHILDKCGKNPTALLGAEYPPFGSNVRLGDPDLVVVEADESDGSFTLLKPRIAVVTNVEAEHLENYEDSEDELWRAFDIFLKSATENCVLNADDKTACTKLDLDNDTPNFGIENEKAGFSAWNVRQKNGETVFNIKGIDPDIDVDLGEFRLGSPGIHNVSNALAALSASDFLTEALKNHALYLVGEPRKNRNKHLPPIHDLLADFHGVKRRFQRIGEANGVLVYDDYGHHPTEVARTLETARDFLQRPVLAVFQPHRYSRTQQMGHEFGPSFAAADKVIITELYSAFEEPIPGVSGRIVFDSVRKAFPDKPVFFADNLDEARCLALEHSNSGDTVFFMGAGDITKVPPLFLQDLQLRG